MTQNMLLTRGMGIRKNICLFSLPQVFQSFSGRRRIYCFKNPDFICFSIFPDQFTAQKSGRPRGAKVVAVDAEEEGGGQAAPAGEEAEEKTGFGAAERP